MATKPKQVIRPPVEIFSSADARRIWVKGQLELIGESYVSIARELGVSRQAVAIALFESRPRMERAIAEKLGMSPSDLFPERYIKGLYSRTRSSKKQEKPRCMS